MDYYEQNYPAYELQNSLGKLEFYLSLLKDFVPPRAQVFELGVGKGLFLREAQNAFQLAGCDVNSDGLAATRKLSPEAPLYLGSTETLRSYALENGSPQAVVSWDVLEHLPDLNAGLQELYEQMRPGTFLIAVVPVYDGPLGWLVRLLDRDPTHVTKTSRAEWLNRIESKGFKIVRWGGILRKLMLGRFYLHFTWPQLLLRSAGTALYFVALKPVPGGVEAKA